MAGQSSIAIRPLAELAVNVTLQYFLHARTEITRECMCTASVAYIEFASAGGRQDGGCQAKLQYTSGQTLRVLPGKQPEVDGVNLPRLISAYM